MQYNILVLDDDHHVRESLVISLEDEGFETYQAESSEKALEVLQETEMDLVVVDLRLPGMNGSEFIEHATCKWPDLKYVIYTGSPEFQIPVRLGTLPNVSNAVFLKPLPDGDSLIAEIRRMLESN